MRLLLGGSPCTKWSIAQTKDRETEPSGIGWELFKNYRIARDKYKPDYFLYENNESMAPAIREQITKELGVPPTPINSARVSAQNRNRLYWVGKRMPDGSYAPPGYSAAGRLRDHTAGYFGKWTAFKRKRVCPTEHNRRNHGGRCDTPPATKRCGGAYTDWHH